MLRSNPRTTITDCHLDNRAPVIAFRVPQLLDSGMSYSQEMEWDIFTAHTTRVTRQYIFDDSGATTNRPRINPGIVRS